MPLVACLLFQFQSIHLDARCFIAAKAHRYIPVGSSSLAIPGEALAGANFSLRNPCFARSPAHHPWWAFAAFAAHPLDIRDTYGSPPGGLPVPGQNPLFQGDCLRNPTAGQAYTGFVG
jgi:hypothetical protein